MNAKEIQQEISTWSFLASGLDQEHQQSVKHEILAKVDALKEQLNDAKTSKPTKKLLAICDIMPSTPTLSEIAKTSKSKYDCDTCKWYECEINRIYNGKLKSCAEYERT
jgi:hypothetical protein